MSLIVEDGTGLSTAESLISVADATAYHAARGNTEWAETIELMTLDVAPAGAGWSAGDTITGATSGVTCVILERVTSMTYYAKERSGAYTLGEVLSNGTIEADQGAANPVFTETDIPKEQWLRIATEYLMSNYRRRWQGVRVSEGQALDFPRDGVVVDSWEVANDEVPTIIERACAELALKAKAGELQPDLEQAVLSEKVGPISVTYDRFSQQAKRFSAIEAMITPFLKPGGGASIKLVRV